MWFSAGSTAGTADAYGLVGTGAWAVPCRIVLRCATQNELEMQRHASREPWTSERTETRLEEIMSAIHSRCV